MPFVAQTPTPFARENILALNPNQMGVYGLFKPGLWIYVGKGDIRERLLSHLNGDNPCITRRAPIHYVAEVCPNPGAREVQLIAELTPVCNQRLG